uniref:Reverse transcriptase Ty1/copia-type domain-containing protein n=1 Tax=Fagus sylvatica TaxID=28930 RepID=A0A2N9FIX9_FAGSY
MASKFEALQRQHTWSLVPPSPSQNIVGCRWVYKIKRATDGSVSRYKARLVAKGFHQQAGVDYAETFSPVVKPPTVRIIHSLAAQNRWNLCQLDVSNAFLHGFLKETVYMAQPIGFIDVDQSSHVCHLHKSLYGLKQASSCLGSVIVYLLLYVDDIIITGSDSTVVSTIISQLSTTFEVKDLGPLRCLTICHCSLDLTSPLLSIEFASLCITLSSAHLVAAKRILRYLKGSLDKGVLFQPGPLTLTAFTDADWAGDPVDRRSTSEAEYHSLATGAAELAWLRQVICDLGLYLASAPIMWCDNTSALALASNPVFHGRTKHIEVDYHFVRERVVRGDICLQFISTDDQVADIFTKALPTPRFQRLCSKLLVCSTDHMFEGG